MKGGVGVCVVVWKVLGVVPCEEWGVVDGIRVGVVGW